MIAFTTRLARVALVAGLAVCGALAAVPAEVRAQQAAMGGANPGFRIPTGLTAQQAAANQAVFPGGNQGGGPGPFAAPGSGGYAGPYSMTSVAPSVAPAAFAPSSPGLYNIGGDPFGGYMSGAASVIGAQGQFLIARRQSDLIRQQVVRAKMDNRRRAIEDFLYERSILPTEEDERERSMAIQLRRAKNDPPLTEIWNATSLNNLLNSIIRQQASGYRGPAIGLDEDVMRNINFTNGREGSNAGLLRTVSEGGSLSWPLGILDLQPKDDVSEIRNQIDSLAKEAVQQAINRKLDAAVLRELTNNVRRMQDLVLRNVREMSPSEYIESKRFLSDLNDALRVLRQPNAGQQLSQKFLTQAKTVPELVNFMTARGLQFAPAVSGGEASYVALQRALAAFDLGSSQGTVATTDTPR